MIYLSIALFAVSAVLGLTILIKWLTKKDASRGVVYSHGIAAVIGLLLLIGYAIQHPENFPKASIILFSVAAVAGLYLFVMDLNKKMSPMALAFTHALVAVAGFVMLLLFVVA
jgi:hypothetical protein